MFEHFTSIQAVIDYFNSIQPIYIYLIIFGLMIIESSFIPFPSEVVIPPAAMIASSTGSNLSIYLIVIVGTFGALLGAYVNYYLGAWLGRPIIHKLANTRLANALLIDQKKIEKAEKYFIDHGKTSTFIGRLVPGIRQLISIPAGISNMSLLSFTVYTILGAGLWNIILALIGYICGQNIAMFESIFREMTIGLLILAALFILYLIYNGIRKRDRKKTI